MKKTMTVTSDAASFRSLTDRFANWQGWMSKNLRHPIWPQIYNMLLSDLTFRTIAHAASLDPESGLHSPILSRGLIAGYWTEQTLYVRRLVDTTSDTVSLYRLIEDIRNALPLMTRQNLIRVWDGGYDPDALSQYAFDRLAGVKPDARKPDDRVRKKIVQTLSAWIDTDEIRQLRDWSHAAIAHAADSASREDGFAKLAPNFDLIERAQRQIVRTAEAISIALLRGPVHGGLVPVLQYSQFRNFEMVVGSEDIVKQAQDKWFALSQDRDKWTDGVVEELAPS